MTLTNWEVNAFLITFAVVLFQSPLFWLFFAIVYAALFLMPSRLCRHLLLLVGSYFFYAAWDVRYLSLIVVSTLIDYFAGQRIFFSTSIRSKQFYLLLSITANLTILGIFKYFNFFSQSLSQLAHLFGIELSSVTLDLVLPVGISFYTFQSMSYTIDIYRQQLEPERSAIRFALYVAFFPQLVAGPIVRARDFLPQLNCDERPLANDFIQGIQYFAWGLIQKIVIADHLGRLADLTFQNPELYSRWALIFGGLAYAGQIYSDFSGYSNMAIGIARVMGYRLPINFDRPYAAVNPREFWQRWHISLSTWLRDYLYIPLGGNRRGELKTYFNLAVVMLLGGLWHGANWTFVVWGAWHGLLLAAHRKLNSRMKLPRYPVAAKWSLCMLAVGLGWICFRSPTFAHFISYLGSVFRPAEVTDMLPPSYLWMASLCLIWVGLENSPIGLWVGGRIANSNQYSQMLIAGITIGLAYMLSLGDQKVFIYFQF